jgi:hypothetical protein
MLIEFLDGTSREIADLHGANLSYANLHGANLSYADLIGVNLRDAKLRDADLSYVNLRDADLSYADLIGVNLSYANLHGANLSYANLRDADLTGTKGLAAFRVCPEVGQFIGFKKVSGAIITLMIPADAKRVNAYGSRKCRAEFAYVLHVERQGQSINFLEAYQGFKYPTSGLVTPDKFDPDPRVECSNGIHFFITRQEAEDYSQ